MAEDSKIYTLAEVSEHADSKDCWLIISGKVYDVTRFLDEHPGGEEALIGVTGRDATDEFEEVGHSSTAKDMMAQYCVGKIDSSTLPAKKTPWHLTQVDVKPDKQTDFLSKMLWLLVSLAILGLAMLFRMHIKAKE